MSTHFPDDDPLAARLRGALSSEADMVQTSDSGLQRIRERTRKTHRPWWQHPAPLAIAAALVLGVAAGGLAVALNDGDNGKVVTGSGGNHTPSPTPSDTGSAEPSQSPSQDQSTPPPVSEPRGIYLYWVHDDPAAGPRLYREKNADGASSMDELPKVVLDDLFAGQPEDSDYASLWPRGTELLDYSVSGDTATVDVSDFPTVGAEAEMIAVQQLVYTVTANDKSVKQVRLLVNGDTPQSGHNDWSQPVARAPMVDVQGFVWIIAPAENSWWPSTAKVGIDGYGTAFEGTINWEIYKVGGDEGPKVAEGHAQGGANGEFGEFHDTVDLPPGTYQIRAFESSAEDGRPLHVDTKTFTVR